MSGIQLCLVLLGAATLRLALLGRLQEYVRPDSDWLIVLAAGFVVVLGLRRRSPLPIPQSQAVTVAAIALGLAIVPPTVLSATGRRIADPVLGRTPKSAALTADFSVLDWVVAWEGTPNHIRYLGATAHVTGFVLHQDGQAYIARLLMTCCAVDAQPVAVALRSKTLPADGSWIDASGTIAQKDGRPLLLVTHVTPIIEPNDPYVY
jgi:putative membrane protein